MAIEVLSKWVGGLQYLHFLPPQNMEHSCSSGIAWRMRLDKGLYFAVGFCPGERERKEERVLVTLGKNCSIFEHKRQCGISNNE